MTDGQQTALTLWEKISGYSFMKKKLSTKNLKRLCRENATNDKTLVVHSEDVDYKPYFPNAYTVTKRPDIPADMHVDTYYKDVANIAVESYDVILCTGLLEHIPDPQHLIDEFYRILKPGGKLIISASAVFSFHECPDDYFHFTPYSFKLLFNRWQRIAVLRGASQPFETIAILMQRILLQTKMFPLFRPLVELLCLVLPLLDRGITAQYNSVGHKNDSTRTDSMLPSNMQAVVVK